MASLRTLIRVLRSVQFFILTITVYILTAILIVLYSFLMLPVLIWDRPSLYKVTNRMLFYCFYISSLGLNYAWKAVVINDLPADYKKKARIYMFNHLSGADPMLVTLVGKRTPLICTYKDALHKIPTSKLILKLTGHIAIEFKYDKVNDKKIAHRDAVKQVMKDAKWSIDNGLNLCVYPEGKRSRDGSLLEFKDGFFRFAVEHGVEIVPCAINNSTTLWPLKSALIGTGVGYLNIGKPIDPKGKTVEELKHETRKAIYNALKECPTFNPEVERVAELEDA